MNNQAPPPPPSQPPSQPPQSQWPPPGTPIHNPYEDTEVMTTGQWIVTLIIFVIPCINIIMAFVWAFGSGNVNRRNFARALLIIGAVPFALMLLTSLIRL